MLLFSVHPEPEGRKVDKMLTLKKVKEMVKAPAHTKRVPSPKVLLEEGRIFLRKEFEHGSHLTLYHNGYSKSENLVSVMSLQSQRQEKPYFTM